MRVETMIDEGRGGSMLWVKQHSFAAEMIDRPTTSDYVRCVVFTSSGDRCYLLWSCLRSFAATGGK